MATIKEKTTALNQAVDIAKEFARSDAPGGPAKVTDVLKNSYKAIVEIIDEIHSSDDSS